MAEVLGDRYLVPKIAIAAFCETPEVAAAVERAAVDRRISRAKLSVSTGGFGEAIELYRQTPSPNLIAVESRSEPAKLFADLESLSNECVTGTKVIVIGHVNDIGLYRELQERGVSDYLVAPFEPLAFIAAIARSFRDTDEHKLGRITAFIGARGGAGSSTIAHNVAASLAARAETDVLLADLDLPFGAVDLDFNVESSPGMADVLQGADRIDEVLLDRLAVQRSERLHLLTAAAGFDRAYDPTESDLDRLLEVARSSARHLVLDLPLSWTSWAKRTLLGADEIVITATPDLVSMRNAKNMVEYLSHVRPNDVSPRLVLNQVGVPRRPEIEPAAFTAAIQLEAAACIPFDAQLFGKASNDGRMITESAGNSQAARAIDDLARIVNGQKGAASQKEKRFSSLMERIIGRR